MPPMKTPRFPAPMRAASVLVCLCVLTPVAPGQSPSPGAADRKMLVGEWQGAIMGADGSKHMDLSLSIGENKIKSSGGRGHQRDGEGTYRISGGTPKLWHIDGTGTAGLYRGKSYLGVLSIEGDTLKWCSAEPGRTRPTALKSDARYSHYLMVLTREK